MPSNHQIERVRNVHHRIALLIATGKEPKEIAEELGISRENITTLKHAPRFQELVAKYKERADVIEYEAFYDVNEVRARIELKAVNEIEARLDKNPESFTKKELLEIQADMADRLGRSKVSRSESVSAHIDLAEALAEARRREQKLSASPALPGDAEGGLVTSSPAEGPAPQSSMELPQ